MESVSHYRLLEPLGRGAMGEVWLAEDTQLPRQVAVKLLPAHLASSEEAVQRLLREAQAAASIDHPAVVTVYEAGMAGDRPYLVMQRVEGQTLGDRLDGGPFEIGEAVDLTSRLADALAEVHALGIVHRDLKPSNIILTPRGPKILDFGIASVMDLPHLTVDGSPMGTPYYMSPEQVEGRPVDNRADLWALGVVLYQLLTGDRPFQGGSVRAILRAILETSPDRPSFLRPEVDPDLEYVVLRLLRKNVDHRYARAEDLIADLAGLERTQAVAAPPASAPSVPRLAVLPFEILSHETDDAYLAAGLAEDLIVDLTRVERLHVTSREEASAFSDRRVPPRTLARELGVDYVLTGSVRRAGSRARINSQLVRGSDGHVIWGERFDRCLDDLFETQAEVSQRIVDALQIALEPGEREMLTRVPTRNREAYTLYLQARELMEVSREDNVRAERLLEQALQLDPEFALAHAAIGECYAGRGLHWWSGKEISVKAMDAVEKALALEPDLPDADKVKLMVMLLVGDSKGVLDSIDRVLSRNPRDPVTLEYAAWSYMSLGKPEDAVRVLRPLEEEPKPRMQSLIYLRNCYQMLGDEEATRTTNARLKEVVLDILRHDPGAVHARSVLAHLLIASGETDAAMKQVDRAVAMAPDDGRIRYNAACANAMAGRIDTALDHLEAAVKGFASFVHSWSLHDPDLETVRKEPRFREIISLGEEE